jgi:transcriptional regulator with XRE-family HTH domain
MQEGDIDFASLMAIAEISCRSGYRSRRTTEKNRKPLMPRPISSLTPAQPMAAEKRCRKSTARSRFLGAQLRARREAASCSAQQIARKMGWVDSTISRIETGSGRVSAVNLVTYLSLCGVVGEEQLALLKLAENPEEDWWVCPHGSIGPDELDPLWFTCSTAYHITVHHPGSVPDLLQSREFSNWQLRARLGNDVTREDLNALVQEQLRRQEVLYRPAHCDWPFYLYESTLRAMPGSDEVRNDQLMHLTLLIAQRRVRIRVLPTGVDHRIPSVGGRFWVFRFAVHAPVVCVQGDAVSVFGEREADVAGYVDIVNRLDALALSDQQSAELIVDLANTERADPALVRR